MHVRTWIGMLGLGLVLALSACGGGTSGNSGTGAGTDDVGRVDQTSVSRPGSGTGDGTGTDATTTATDATSTSEQAMPLSIDNKPDRWEYVQGVMSAPAGSNLLINYNNASDEQHNWVLVQPGKEQAVADAAGSKGGDPSGIEGVIAWSQPLASGTTQIEVPALEQGGYTYLCTVPGHFAAGHKGALDVK